jgi:hypothetical protein
MYQEFEIRLDEVASYIEDLGDKVVERNVEDILTTEVDAEEYSLTGHWCKQDGHQYIIAGHPELRFMSCLYAFSIERYVASLLTDEEAEVLGSIEEDYEEDTLESAGRYILKTLDQEEMRALSNYLYMFVSGGTSRTATHIDEQGVFVRYSVSTLFFPFEESFGIRTFHEGVRSSLTAGRRGHRLLNRTLFIESDEQNPEDLSLTANFGW